MARARWFRAQSPRPKLACDPTRESYDQAFGLLAAAWTYALDGKRQTIDFAYRTLQFLEVELASLAGGYAEADSARLPRRQNPHMHLFEAFLALYEVTCDPVFMARADAIHALLEQRFVSAAGALREYFDESWQPAQGAAGEIVEPGHHFEWVWLLYQHARLAARPVSPLAEQLFVFACKYGLDWRSRRAARRRTVGGGPSARSSIAPCRPTSRPGSRSPARGPLTAIRCRPTSSASSAACPS